MICAGIDGCKGGWISVIRKEDRFEILNLVQIAELLELPYNIDLALIDIPLGLGSSQVQRDVESLARHMLRPIRHASVFSPPVREAIRQESYEMASRTNRSITGKKITIQTWNIVPKIRELDRILLDNPWLKERLLEAHPEICFKFLNQGRIPEYRKREPGQIGIEERVNILNQFFADSESFYRSALIGLDSSRVRPDDLVDALGLCVTATMGAKYGLRRLREESITDDHNIEMNMRYFHPDDRVPSTAL